MDLVFFISSLLLVWFKTTTAISLGDGNNGVIMNDKKCRDNEKQALLDFKYLLQDPNESLSTWRAENDCCEWSGVTCNNQTGHVTELDLGVCNLVGEISLSLFNLTYLTHLNLFSNSFNGTVSESIGFLTELTYLDLSWNSFNGSIPRSIGSLTKLTYLDLGGNSFNGTIPNSIGSLIELTHLRFSYNYFLKGTIPSEFRNLANLQEFLLEDLTSCTIENMDWLSGMSELRDLNLDGTSLAKANNWVNAILSLQKLSALSLSGCHLSHVMHPYSSSSSSSVNSSSPSSNIVYLDLSDNNLNSSMYHWMFPLTSNTLVTLYLSGNMLDTIPKYLGNLCNMTYFNFVNNSVVINFPDFLINLSGCTSVTLQTLEASNSLLIGSLSDEFQKFLSLERLNLFNNQLNGTISAKLWELPNLRFLDLSSNFLKGPISENIGKSKNLNINLSNNSLEGVPSNAQMSNLSYVLGLDLSSCKKLGPRFPKWIQELKNLTRLDISNTRISDTIPLEFWSTWPSRLTYLNLSSNNISGKVPDLISNFDPLYSRIDLSSNKFNGPIPNVSSTVETLNLARNQFYGGISSLCQIVDGALKYLDLSHNSLTGQLPDCLWNFKALKILNLGNNNLSGRIPSSVQFLIELEVLNLYSNDFSGELPLSLKNCTALTFLDLGANRFSGNVPVWIGENLSRLYVLSLKSNHFFGTIPVQLCQLVNLQILDLSMNNLYGTIPSCVNNLTSLRQQGLLLTQNVHSYDTRGSIPKMVQSREYADRAMIQWQGNIQEFSTNLRLLKSIDLSSNNLSGKIPYELTDLLGLLALNLSKNTLIGEIPRGIGQMKELLTLDLSRNNLSGNIPSNISQMASLSYLDVSYNNLSGRVPTGSQLQTFEPSWFTGNAGLCGLPATKRCPGDENLQIPPTVDESRDGGEVGDEHERWFYIGGASGFATGFWIVCSALLLNRRGRHAFFNFLDNLRDWVYVKLIVLIAIFANVVHV